MLNVLIRFGDKSVFCHMLHTYLPLRTVRAFHESMLEACLLKWQLVTLAILSFHPQIKPNREGDGTGSFRNAFTVELREVYD